jgi:DNA invertase Pin-like site-specific DNA recombinase
MTKAIGYLRTSSSTNVGADKDSHKRQRAAIEAYAASSNTEIVDWFYDADVRGADPIEERPGFAAMLERIESNGVRTIIVEGAHRFARDLRVQENGYEYLKDAGITLIAAESPSAFLDDTPTARLIRQILGAVSEFEKAQVVNKLKGARERIKAETGKCGGRKSHAEKNPELVARVKCLAQDNVSLRGIALLLEKDGILNGQGSPYSASAIKSMLDS